MVLDLFLDSVSTYGWPSHIRGDHGTENILVAQEMEDKRGVEHRLYIWGWCIPLI